MLDLFKSNLVATAIWAVVATLVAKFFVTGYKMRSRMHKLPGPGQHSMIWGHLRLMGEIMQEVPLKVHPHTISLRLKQKYGIEEGYFYVDVWPFSNPLLYIVDPAIAQQVTVDYALPKHSTLRKFLYNLTGPGDLVSSNGGYWKKWRSIMNPGFAASHLMTLVPGIVDDSVIFATKMGEHADAGDVFRLEEEATRLTVDIIGKVALDLRFNTQRGENEMVSAFRDQVQLVPNGGPLDPFSYYMPIKFYKRWRNSRIMTKYIGKVMDERFARSGGAKEKGDGGRKGRKRAIIDLAMDSYLTQLDGGDAETAVQHKAPVMNAEFRTSAITQIRTFIFAGHDTTSSTICYATYMLQKTPSALARIRQEHNSFFGSIEETADKIKADPYILNKLEYTNAVIKETLRLWPAASAIRTGEPGFMIHDPKTGESFPTEDLLVWVPHWAVQRDPAIWGADASEFRPERFLPENEASLPEGAWRPFERGARNCIGQELAMLETRIILALIVRNFDFTLALDRLDELDADGSVYTTDANYRKGRQDLDGEEMYQVLVGSAKPREGMPVTVKRV